MGFPTMSAVPNGITTPSAPLWRQAAPFVVAALLVWWVLSRLRLDLLRDALVGAPFLPLLAFAAVWNLVLLAADAYATAMVYRTTVCAVGFWPLFVIRGASYLPSLLNHHVGQGWLTYFFSKAYRAPLWRVTGATLVVYVTTFGCLVGFGVCALPFNTHRLAWMGPLLAACVSGGVAYLLVLQFGPVWLRHRPFLAPLFELGVAGHFRALVARAPHVIVLFFGTWVPLYAFGVALPWTDALALIPPVMFVSALPVTPQGVGTRDALSVYLFAEFAGGSAADGAARVAASTLSWALALTLVQLVSSPILMRRAFVLLRRPSDEPQG